MNDCLDGSLFHSLASSGFVVQEYPSILSLINPAFNPQPQPQPYQLGFILLPESPISNLSSPFSTPSLDDEVSEHARLR